MARVTIQIDDVEGGLPDQMHMVVTFDPPIAKGTTPMDLTAAQRAAIVTMETMREHSESWDEKRNPEPGN